MPGEEGAYGKSFSKIDEIVSDEEAADGVLKRKKTDAGAVSTKAAGKAMTAERRRDLERSLVTDEAVLKSLREARTAKGIVASSIVAATALAGVRLRRMVR